MAAHTLREELTSEHSDRVPGDQDAVAVRAARAARRAGAETCSTRSSSPRRACQYGASTHIAEPVTESSGMPSRGPKTRQHDVERRRRRTRAVTSTASVSSVAHRVEVGRELAHRGRVGELGEREERRARRQATGSTPSAAATPGPARRFERRRPGSRARRGRRRASVRVSTPLSVWNVAVVVGVEPARVPERVRARERRVPAQRDLRLGREPPQPVRAVGAGEEERRLRVLHLGRDARIHSSATSSSRKHTPAGLPRNGSDANASTHEEICIADACIPACASADGDRDCRRATR